MRAKTTCWFPRRIVPVRTGRYECLVQISRACPPLLWSLFWDGKGFVVPCPMIVRHWRGLTKGGSNHGKR